MMKNHPSFTPKREDLTRLSLSSLNVQLLKPGWFSLSKVLLKNALSSNLRLKQRNSLPTDVLWGSFLTRSDERTPKDVCGEASKETVMNQ